MEGLDVGSIPNIFLGRILIQLHIIQQDENLDLLSVISNALKLYGHTSNLDAFLNYCSTCVWEHYTVQQDDDWEKASIKKNKDDIVGIRFLIQSELVRKSIEAVRLGKEKTYDPKCTVQYKDQLIPIDQILTDTHSYLKQENKLTDTLEGLFRLGLDNYARHVKPDVDTNDYCLMGVLMVRYDGTVNRGYSAATWCLYLRNYIDAQDGSVWRILLAEGETKISSDQALADIRGIDFNGNAPSGFSKAYRPVYLFYFNQTLFQRNEQVITLEDYTFDEQDYEQTEEESSICKICHIGDIVDDVNDLFICEHCNLGVHQLCEQPPIEEFEKEIDPWFCRQCSHNKGLPLKRKRSLQEENIQNKIKEFRQ